MELRTTTPRAPRATTGADCDFGCMYDYYGGPEKYWIVNDPDYYYGMFDDLNNNDIDPYIRAFKKVDEVVSFVGFAINILHLFFLTQKELRTNFIFILMIGICLNDIFVFSMTIVRVVLQYDVFELLEEDCTQFPPYYQAVMIQIGLIIQSISRQSSAFLALCMAVCRAVSVVFPMSTTLHRILKPQSALILALCSFVIFGSWGAALLAQGQMQEDDDCPTYAPQASYSRYYWRSDEEMKDLYEVTNGCFVLVLSFLYLAFTIPLLLELRTAQKRRRSLKSEKSENSTTRLVVLMSASFLFTELTFGMFFLLDRRILAPLKSLEFFFKDFNTVPQAMITVNSTLHCFICFFMSTQYRDAIRRVVQERTGVSSVVTVEPTSSVHTL